MVKEMDIYQFNNHFYKYQYNYLENFMESTQILFL
jgi:hypothetical protein